MTDHQAPESTHQPAQIYKGLEWLVDEIERNLTSALNELEAFTKDTSDETKIYFCLGHLHQISGPFKILQCQGLILLAEEMEALTQSIINRQVSSINEACEIMVQIIVRLPAYLRQVLITKIDQPEALILLLNDLRAAQGKSLLSEGILFTPDLSQIATKTASTLPSGVDANTCIEALQRLRQVYQISLIKLIKDDRSDKHYANLEKVFQRLQGLCAGTWRQDLWHIAEQVLKLLAQRRIDFSITLKKLFRVLDSQLKHCQEDIRAERTSAMEVGLLKNLLYYLMIVKPETDSQYQLWQAYNLFQALPSGVIDVESSRFVPRYEVNVVRSLVSAIQAELNHVRCALEQVTLDGGLSSEDVREALPILSRMSDSLALVGQGQLREAVDHIYQGLQQIFNSDTAIDDNEIATAVHQLTEVAATLSAWSAYPERFAEEISLGQNQTLYELETARDALLSESRTGIERIKELVVDYINSQWNPDLIKSLPDHFYELSGGLKIMEFSRAASIIDGCGIYVQEHLINQAAKIEWQSLDAFAETISIIEYYLEQMSSSASVDQEAILDTAEDSIARLLETAVPSTAETNSHQASQEYCPKSGTKAGDADQLDAEKNDDKTATKSQIEKISEQNLEIENEILDIFLEEAKEVMETLKSNILQWESNPEAIEALTIIRRSFHTLKGSGRMVSATHIGDLSWAIENMLNRILDGRLAVNQSIYDVVKLSINLLENLIAEFPEEINEYNQKVCRSIINDADQLSIGQTPAKLKETKEAYNVPKDSGAKSHKSLSDIALATDISEFKAGPEWQPKITLNDSEKGESDDAKNNDEKDSIKTISKINNLPKLNNKNNKNIKDEKIIQDIFFKEAKTHLRTVDHYLIKARSLDPDYQPPTFVLQRALHTLKGAADMAGFSHLSELVSPVDDFVKELINHQISIDEDIIFLINDMISIFRDLLNQVCTEHQSDNIFELPDGLELFFPRLQELQEKFVGGLLRTEQGREHSEALLAIKSLMATGLYALQDYPQLLQQLENSVEFRAKVCEKIIADLEAVIKSSDMIALSELSGLLLDIYREISGSTAAIEQPALALLEESHEALLNLFDMLAADQDLPRLTEAKRQDFVNLCTQIAKTPTSEKGVVVDPSLPLEAVLSTESRLPPEAPTPDRPTTSEEPSIVEETADQLPQFAAPDARLETDQWLEPNLDSEIAEVFVEEAEDIVSHLEETLHGWMNEPDNAEFADQLKRDLHTFKGGARMAGFGALGQYSHEFETAVENIQRADSGFFKLLEAQLERLVAGYEIARLVAQGHSAAKVDQEISKLLEKNYREIIRDQTKSPAVFEQSSAPQSESPPASSTFGSSDLNQATSQARIREVVRIGSETLDALVNLSGENIIFRGRVEEQVSEFTHSLDEMDATIVRLQEQIRRLGNETVAQIAYRREQIQAAGEESSFDPLEMDRYSQLQQLSGSLVESASDLSDLKETLVDKLVGAESLLMHQSRINVDLQEGLMQTRMVPFSRIVPRLRRIVRQVSLELGKEVMLAIDNVQGDMDRSVLDRMVAPIEHMVRNAIDHGIESHVLRESAGKPAQGTISITSYRKGGDILIHIADDGAGLDMVRIKELALKKQLMHENAMLSDHEIAQFIFHPGFTTTDSVSEISGRGVGMDVVSREVKQLGGAVDIQSTPGRGTEFTVVLPFTLAVNRALMVKVAQDHYALSLNSIDGVHFVSPQKLQASSAEGACIEYANRRYEVLKLAALLDRDISSQIENDHLSESIALVLFHSDNRYFAAQVDEIIGTQEIVVKNLGAQFSVVPGLGGATILSDGRVVVIVDLNELARVAISDHQMPAKAIDSVTPDKPPAIDSQPELHADEPLRILVIDDSVTVRKVTSRVLKRHGYRVATAKDGVEALSSMHDKMPHLMLLDIEMPRMDGFEVAMRVRASAELNHIPIIMITSRTGDKHRQRAMELGVDRYMGKPYQEDQLLAAIDELLPVGSH